jgi:hypothetical protein
MVKALDLSPTPRKREGEGEREGGREEMRETHHTALVKELGG